MHIVIFSVLKIATFFRFRRFIFFLFYNAKVMPLMKKNRVFSIIEGAMSFYSLKQKQLIDSETKVYDKLNMTLVYKWRTKQ